MNTSQASVRNPTWDIARGMGMMLVIYGHLLEPLYPARPDLGRGFVHSAFVQWQFIYSFHMLLFFFVSGAVNKNLAAKNWRDVLRGSLRLLALAWIVHLLGVATQMALGLAPDAASLGGAAAAFLLPILQGYYWSIGVLWFLTSLCFVQLLAYCSLQRLAPLWIALASILGTALIVYVEAPNEFLFRTWFAGLCFFALGVWAARSAVRWRPWMVVPLALATAALAPLNSGCAYTWDDPCSQFSEGPFGVRMFAGNYGFLPLFFLTAACGTAATVALSAGIARTRLAGAFAYVGEHSLDLFIINGFVATFLPPTIARIHWPHFTAGLYVIMAAGVIAAHLIALRLLKGVLRWIDVAAVWVATRLVPRPRLRESVDSAD